MQWSVRGSSRADIIEALADTRRAASEEGFEQLTLDRLDQGIRALNDKTGKGIAQTSPPMLEALPRKGKKDMLTLLRGCERELAWPWQLLRVTIALLQKPTG